MYIYIYLHSTQLLSVYSQGEAWWMASSTTLSFLSRWAVARLRSAGTGATILRKWRRDLRYAIRYELALVSL